MTNAATPASIDTKIDALEQRLATLTQVRAAFPDADPDKLMHIVEWVLTGSMPLAPAALEAAGKRLAVADGEDWTYQSVRNRYRGLATTTVAAYFSATR